MKPSYRYDGNGNRTGKAGEQRLAGGEVSSLHTTYRYNVRGQFLEENRNGEADVYSYDSAGNRTRKESPDGTASYCYNEKNQLVSEEGIHGRKNFTYNRQGSIIEGHSFKDLTRGSGTKAAKKIGMNRRKKEERIKGPHQLAMTMMSFHMLRRNKEVKVLM